MIKLPYYFVKTCLWYFYSSSILGSRLSVLEAFQVPPFRCRNFSGPPAPLSSHPPPPPSRNLWTIPKGRSLTIQRLTERYKVLELYQNASRQMLTRPFNICPRTRFHGNPPAVFWPAISCWTKRPSWTVEPTNGRERISWSGRWTTSWVT